VVGHSLGGAIATMFALVATAKDPALMPRLTLYTLASPALGDSTFARYFDAHVPSSFRVWNAADIVPLALQYIYTAVDGAGQEIIETPAQAAEVRGTWACAHSLLTYLWLLDPNNHFAPNFKASACNVGKPEAAEARRALRVRQLAQLAP
jgi:triacylglycerol lipase